MKSYHPVVEFCLTILGVVLWFLATAYGFGSLVLGAMHGDVSWVALSPYYILGWFVLYGLAGWFLVALAVFSQPKPVDFKKSVMSGFIAFGVAGGLTGVLSIVWMVTGNFGGGFMLFGLPLLPWLLGAILSREHGGSKKRKA